MRLPMKPSQTPERTAIFFSRFGERETGGDHVRPGLVGNDDFHKPHHMGGREEMQADDVLRPRGRRRDLVDVEIGGVGGQNRTGLAHPVEGPEDLALDAHFLERGLDDQINVRQCGEVGACGELRRQDVVASLLRQLAPLDRAVEVL
jgi:hypothetical protein